jgi:hypothetical protein
MNYPAASGGVVDPTGIIWILAGRSPNVILSHEVNVVVGFVLTAVSPVLFFCLRVMWW